MRTRGRLVVCVLIALLLGACAQDPNVKKQQYLERGLAYHKEAKYNEAILQLKNALQIDPKFAPALHAIGRAYRAKSWSVDAMRELQRAVELEPDNLEARADLAQAYLDLDGWNAALEQADAIRARVPETAAELYVRAAALNGKGDVQQAVTLLSKGLALGSGTPELQRALGDSLAILGRPSEAEKAYRDALAQRPKYPDALIGLSALLLRQGQRDAALELVTQAKAVAPQSPKVAMASSEIHARDGKLADGSPAPDGSYALALVVTDDVGTFTRTANVTFDTVPPRVTVISYRNLLFRVSEPGGAFALAACLINSLVRWLVRSATTAPTPYVARSGGISVVFIQVPLA